MRHLATTDRDYCHTTEDFRVDGHLGSYRIGLICEGREGRKVFQGPICPGPWGWVSQNASVIDASGQSYRHLMACPTLTEGEHFTVEHLPGVWALSFGKANRWERPSMQLVQVSDPSDTPAQ
jgi:hypothetical protein